MLFRGSRADRYSFALPCSVYHVADFVGKPFLLRGDMKETARRYARHFQGTVRGYISSIDSRVARGPQMTEVARGPQMTEMGDVVETYA